jgi:hypothetical protein
MPGCRFSFKLRLYGLAKPIPKLPGHVTGRIGQNDSEFVTTEARDMVRARAPRCSAANSDFNRRSPAG